MPSIQTNFDEHMVAALLDIQPDSIVWYVPVFSSEQQIVDFTINYCNEAACKFLNSTASEVLGTRLLSSAFRQALNKEEAFKQCLQVWNTGQTQEFNFYSAVLNKFFNVQRTKVLDGVLSVIRDQTNTTLIEQEKQKHAERYNSILNASLNGIIALQCIRNAENAIEDFMVTEANDSGFRKNGLQPDAIGKSLLQLDTGFISKKYFDLCKDVVNSGKPIRKEIPVEIDGELFYFLVSWSKLDDGVVINVADITQSKNYEATIKLQANQLQSILDASIDPICAMRALKNEAGEIIDLVFVMVNKNFTDRGTTRKEDHIGKRYLDLYPQAKTVGLFDILKKVILTGTPFRSDFLNSVSTPPKWFALSATRYSDEGVLLIYSDITEAKNSKKELEDAARRLQNIINTAKIGITLIKPFYEENELIDFKIDLANNIMSEQSGFATELIKEELIGNLLPAYKRKGIFDVFKDTLLTGKTNSIKLFYDEDRLNGWFHITCTKLEDDIVVTINDFTALKKSIDEQEHLKQLNEFKDEFLSIASHELKTPLTSVKAYLQLADRNESLSDENRIYIQKAITNVSKLERLIADLLDATKINSGQIVYSESVFTCKNLVEESVDIIRKGYHSRNIIVSDTSEVLIKGDKVRLEQVLCNVLSNAVKYSSKDVMVYTECDGMMVRVFVQDYGIGITEEDRTHLFNRFYRANRSSMKFPGLGLGLYISSQIIKDHKGTITVESEPGKGSVFCIQLPVA